MASQAPAIIEADVLNNDSAYDATSVRDSTTSISSSILKYREEHGRTYHANKDGSYMFPNDETEQNRMDLNYHMWQLCFDGKILISKIPEGKVLKNVLDVGTGTGIWAIDFADAHPDSTVLGVDLSGSLPPNLFFEVDDISEPWPFKQHFDLIYSRMMIGSLTDVPKFIAQSFTNLTPGGYLEMAEATYPFQISGGVWPEGSALLKWCDLMVEAAGKAGRSLDNAQA